MAISEQLQKLHFLVGEWKGRSEDQFGEKGVIETSLTFTQDPSDHFISERDVSWKGDKMVNRSVSFLMWDPNIKKYVRKSVFSYGWINNEVGVWKDDGLLFDIVSIDGEPSFFKGVRWRSFLRKYSENEIGSGLEVAKKREPFRPYGESRARRV